METATFGIGSSIIEKDGKYTYVIHGIAGAEDKLPTLQCPEWFDTIDIAKTKGSAKLTEIIDEMKRRGMPAERRDQNSKIPIAITKEEFASYTYNLPGSIQALHDEREWWMARGRIGVIIRDRVDDDWGWAALARNPNDQHFQAYDFRASLPTIDDARKALHQSFEEDLRDGWWK